MQQDISTQKQTSCLVTRNDQSMSLPSLVRLGPCTPENRLSVMPHPKIAWQKHAKLSITQCWIT